MIAMRDAYDTMIAAIYYMIYHAEKAEKLTERCLKWLSNTDFYIAPASTVYHDSEPCGLLKHTLRVVDKMIELLSLHRFRGLPDMRRFLLHWFMIGVKLTFMNST